MGICWVNVLVCIVFIFGFTVTTEVPIIFWVNCVKGVATSSVSNTNLSCLSPTLITVWFKDGESLFLDSQSIPARDSCGVIPYTNGGTVGYCSPSCPPYLSSWSNSSVVYWTNAVVGVEGILTLPPTWSLFKTDQGRSSLGLAPHLLVTNSPLISS